MISVLSNYLDPLIDAGLLQDAGDKPSAIYEQLSIAYNQGSPGVANCVRWYLPYYEPESDDEFCKLLNYIWSNKDLQEEIRYLNYKLIPEFATMSYQTINVRVRIFTSKLAKKVEKGLIDKTIKNRILDILVKNLRREKHLIIDEDLPF